MEGVNTKDDRGFVCLRVPIYVVFSFYPASLEFCKAAATLIFFCSQLLGVIYPSLIPTQQYRFLQANPIACGLCFISKYRHQYTHHSNRQNMSSVVEGGDVGRLGL